MSDKGTSGWQQAMLTMPDRALPEGNTASSNETKATKKRKSVSVEAVEDVKRPKLYSQEFPEKKGETKMKKTPPPTRSTSIVEHQINENDRKATDEKEKHGDGPKGTQDTAPVLSRRTRSTSRQLEPDGTHTSESNKEDKEKAIHTPEEEAKSTGPQVLSKNKETSDVDKGETLVPAIRTTKTKRKLSLDEKEDFNEAHKANVVSDVRPVVPESSSTLDYKGAADLEKPTEKPKETNPKVRRLNETKSEAKKPREKKATRRATPARAPESFYNYRSANSSAHTYDNMIRSMTNNLRREWGGVGVRYGRGRRRR